MSLREWFRRLRRDTRGNVLMIFGFSLLPLTFAVGMGIDYGDAMRLQTKLNAAADSAALAATSAAMMDKTLAEAETQARTVFKVQVEGSAGLKPMDFLDPAQFNVTVTETTTQAEGRVRIATVTYRGESLNDFAGVLGQQTLTIKGLASAKASTAPNIDFYVLLDASSSMALPTTTAGINFLKSRTVTGGNPNGCAFACHQSNPDNGNIRDANGNIIDYYQFAHNNNIELRIDAGKHAIADMITEAEKEGQENEASYRFYVATFDRATNYRALTGTTPTGDFNLARQRAASAETVAVQMHAPNYDRQTEASRSLAKAKADMPAMAGNGMRGAGNTPQAVMFLITDGMRDETLNGREIGPFTSEECDAIKARGVRIAVLYTTYTPASIEYDPWSRDNVLWRLPSVSPALQACASKDLFFEVSTDGNISAALNALFQKTITSARLIR